MRSFMHVLCTSYSLVFGDETSENRRFVGHFKIGERVWFRLCDVMLNNVSYQLHIHPFDYQGIYDELSKNEQELRFS